MILFRHALLAAALVAAAPAAYAQQTLTFSNSNPQITVPLTGTSTFNFQDNGNVTATCQLGPDNRCVGLPASTCGVPPGVSLLPSDFSQSPDGTGQYPPGTTVNLFPQVTGADVCIRETTAGTPTGSGWEGIATSGLSTTVPVTLTEGGATYGFSLRCYGAGGKQTSSTITVRTNTVNVPGSCTGVNAGATGFAWDQTYLRFPDVPRLTQPTLRMLDFPNTGAPFGKLTFPTGRWVSIAFRVPDNLAAFTGLNKSINWQEAQIGGSANVQTTYISVSNCRGDFRVPNAGTASVGDHTLALGCRNLRPGNNTIGIRYEPTSQVTGSTNTMCNLKMGETYYFNMILANPYDGGGIQPGESSCLVPGATTCGIQLKAE